ncbi:MAG: hypothetical protein I3270_01860 [Candidatus Moeniiplasma glomeromycotorum]|nr:hypothetical protein [Candidatus Moeniiplasma glomeromycotorum]MCE8162447.1 hypothetical protein [Candidatus Moeniiplasma glomeromycotorum]MCE8166373.1 hypothetical protein [Candidatus Moeniiplasma glomeromycotorum]MCE8166855.1 hypothetical protein [Candidatus Moeniiplasma glomeromycotorum]
MLCANCYKKIPEGEEVQKAASHYWRASWNYGGGGSEVVCKRCAIKIRKREKYFLIFFLGLWLFGLVISIVICIVKYWG